MDLASVQAQSSQGLLYGVFYGSIRLGLENFRIGNWLLAGGVPTATIISSSAILICGGALIYRHVIAPRRATPRPEAQEAPSPTK